MSSKLTNTEMLSLIIVCVYVFLNMTLCIPGSGADCETDGSLGLQRPGAVKTSPGGHSGKCNLYSSISHTDATGVTGKHTVTHNHSLYLS